MFGAPGHAYVYLVYGMHRCLNVVTEPADRPAAVLIRAVRPLEGTSAMRASRFASEAGRRRGLDALAAARLRDRLGQLADSRLASGPGLVCAAFGIEVAMSGLDLLDASSPLRLEAGVPADGRPPIVETARIGVEYAGEPWAGMPWRFALEGEPSVSGPPARSPRLPR